MKLLKVFLLRLFIFAVLIILTATPIYSQNTYAILSHNGETSIFYGEDALIEANEKSVSGDLITLSSGAFKAAIISNSITIRGTGMNTEGKGTVLIKNRDCYDGLNQYGLSIWGNSNSELSIVVEGIEDTYPMLIGSGSRIDFINCKGNVHFAADVNDAKSLRFIRCFISGDIRAGGNSQPYIMTNCVVNGSVGYANMTNCIMDRVGEHCSTTNCLILHSGGWGDYMANCIVISNQDEENGYFQRDKGALEEISPSSQLLVSTTPIFKEGTLYYELLPENAANWLGNDGTQIGIHGGQLPFTPIVSGPKITSFKVADKTTSEGMLNMEITIE